MKHIVTQNDIHALCKELLVDQNEYWFANDHEPHWRLILLSFLGIVGVLKKSLQHFGSVDISKDVPIANCW